jgi:nucleotide-binding universal stress UspA family protein
MNVLIWLSEGTWEACVDAAADLAPADARFTLLHVIDPRPEHVAHAAHRGLMGRARPDADPAAAIDRTAVAAQTALLRAAGERLRRPAARDGRRGRTEHEVLTACHAADLLIMARDTGHPGPRGIGPTTRFVLDHAPCRVLLVRPR